MTQVRFDSDASSTRKFVVRLRAQRTRVVLPLALVAVTSLAALGLVLLIRKTVGVSFGFLMRDPAGVSAVSPIRGFFSHLGVLVWASAAAISLFSAAITRRAGDRRGLRSFLLCAGFFTALLTLDDLYMFHEIVFPYLFGIREELVVVGYAVLLLSGLVVFSRTILETDFLLLVVALGFFALSVAIDVLVPFSNRQVFWEDGSKFVGIVCWLAYFSHVSALALRQGRTERSRAPAPETKMPAIRR